MTFCGSTKWRAGGSLGITSKPGAMSGVIGLYATAIIVGWIGGGLVNWAADILPGAQEWRVVLSALKLNRHTYWAPAWRMEHWRSPAVILVSMGLTSLLAWRYGWGATLGIAWLYGLFLLAVAVIDFEQHRVLNVMLAQAVFVIALFSFLPATPDPVNMLLGGAVGFGVSSCCWRSSGSRRAGAGR